MSWRVCHVSWKAVDCAEDQAELCLQLHSCTHPQMGQTVNTTWILFQSATKINTKSKTAEVKLGLYTCSGLCSLLCPETSTCCYSGCHTAQSWWAQKGKNGQFPMGCRPVGGAFTGMRAVQREGQCGHIDINGQWPKVARSSSGSGTDLQRTWHVAWAHRHGGFCGPPVQ